MYSESPTTKAIHFIGHAILFVLLSISCTKSPDKILCLRTTDHKTLWLDFHLCLHHAVIKTPYTSISVHTPLHQVYKGWLCLYINYTQVQSCIHCKYINVIQNVNHTSFSAGRLSIRDYKRPLQSSYFEICNVEICSIVKVGITRFNCLHLV